MLYATNEDLPTALRRGLPAHDRDAAREVRKHARCQYGDDAQDAVEIDRRVVRGAVRKRYRKRDGSWTAIKSP
jgi:cation transport regulator ChaB